MVFMGATMSTIAILLIILSIFTKRDGFFNIKQLTKDYFALFNKSKKHHIVFWGYPMILSIGVSLMYDARAVFFDNLCIVLSIILSMLFSVLAIITNFNYDKNASTPKDTQIIRVVRETSTAIIFTSLLCIVLLIYCITMLVIQDCNFKIDGLSRLLGGIAYYMSTVLFLNVLLVIKRIGKIIDVKITAKE